MRKRRMTMLAAMTAALLALVIGASYAAAQDQTQTQAQTTQGQNGARQGGPRGGRMVGGEVVKVDNDTITLKTIKDGTEKTVKVDDQTRYRKDGKAASLADVTAGEKIGVVLGKKPDDGSDPTAKAVMIGKPGGNRQGGNHAVGTVSAINGDTVTITTANGDKQVKLPTITQGMKLGVVTAADGTVRAVMYNPPDKPQNAPDGPAVAPEAAPANN